MEVLKLPLLFFFFVFQIYFIIDINNVARTQSDTAALCQIIQQIYIDFNFLLNLDVIRLIKATNNLCLRLNLNKRQSGILKAQGLTLGNKPKNVHYLDS